MNVARKSQNIFFEATNKSYRQRNNKERSARVSFDDLTYVVDFLGIDILKAPLANAMIQDLYRMHQGDRELIEAIILSLDFPDEFKGLLAKYWFLNYGQDYSDVGNREKAFILPELDYGFSIEELLAYDKLPKIQEKVLMLFSLRINDLTGLTSIPGIKTVENLFLVSNKITRLPPGLFAGFNVFTTTLSF